MQVKGKLTVDYPLTCDTIDLDGHWIIVNLIEYLGNGKWKTIDWDGNIVFCDWAQLRPRE